MACRPEPPAEKPVPVVVTKPSTMWSVPEPDRDRSAPAAIVIVLAPSSSIQQRELRARVIRLFGHDQLAAATRLLDEASQRISRYAAHAIPDQWQLRPGHRSGALPLGVPFAFRPGSVSKGRRCTRFLHSSFVGAWVAALSCPSCAEPGRLRASWTPPYFIMDSSPSLSVVAFVIKTTLCSSGAAFGSRSRSSSRPPSGPGCGGPMGLMLSTPLTVLLVVFARTVDGRGFVEILLSDEAGTGAVDDLLSAAIVAGTRGRGDGGDWRKHGEVRLAGGGVRYRGRPALARVRLDPARRLCGRTAVAHREGRPAPRGSAAARTHGRAPAGAGRRRRRQPSWPPCRSGTPVDEAGLAMPAARSAHAGYLQHIVPAGRLQWRRSRRWRATGLPLICVGAVGSGGGRRLRDLVRRACATSLRTRPSWSGGAAARDERRAAPRAPPPRADTVVTSLDEARAEALRHIAPAKEATEGTRRHRGAWFHSLRLSGPAYSGRRMRRLVGDSARLDPSGRAKRPPIIHRTPVCLRDGEDLDRDETRSPIGAP